MTLYDNSQPLALLLYNDQLGPSNSCRFLVCGTTMANEQTTIYMHVPWVIIVPFMTLGNTVYLFANDNHLCSRFIVKYKVPFS